MYKSPQADMGYDISDYKAIDPIYGTNEDLDRLQSELKKRSMKLMMDLVVNHTSEQVRPIPPPLSLLPGLKSCTARLVRRVPLVQDQSETVVVYLERSEERRER